MARQTPRRRAWTAIALVIGVVAIGAGAWGLQRWQPFAHEAEKVAWPKNVQPLATYVEHELGLTFLHNVRIEFIPNDELYTARSHPASPPRTAAAKDRLVADAAMGRALGYWAGEISLADEYDAIRAAGDSPVVYLASEHTIVVHAYDASTSLNPDVRVELASRLALILDDQHYDLTQRATKARTSQEYEAIIGLQFGDESWLRNEYISSLSAKDRTDYRTAVNARGDDYDTAVANVSPVYRALRVDYDQAGPAFVAVMRETSRTALADAFTKHSPTALDQLMLPTAKYLHSDTAEPVADPPVPKAGTLVRHAQIGPFGLYLMMAAGLTPQEALTAADGWGNDRVTLYRLHDQVCVDGRIVADSRDDAALIARGLDAWAGSRPKESGALVGRDGTTLLFSVCDPGTKVREQVPGQAALDQWFGRSILLRQELHTTNKPDLAECVATAFYQQFTDLQATGTVASFDLSGELQTLTDKCRSEV